MRIDNLLYVSLLVYAYSIHLLIDMCLVYVCLDHYTFLKVVHPCTKEGSGSL